MTRTFPLRLLAAAFMAMVLNACGERNEVPPAAQPISSRPGPVAVAGGAPAPRPAGNPSDFAVVSNTPSKLPVYEIQIKRESLAAMDRNPYGPELYPATFSFEGQSYDVKIRYRGAWARSWPKKPLKIFFEDKRPFKGLHH